MPEDFAYTPEEVAKILKISRFTVYEIIKRGELEAYRIGRKMRIEPAELERYKENAKGNSRRALGENLDEQPVQEAKPSVILSGQDIVLDILVRHFEKNLPSMQFLRSHMSSMDGLLALYHGTAQIATAHLWDGDTGEYNLPYVRRLLPGHHVVLLNLVYRTVGFYVAEGNPKNIKDWPDLTRSDVKLINRERGSGSRVLLDEQLRKLNIDFSDIRGYETEETSHLLVASAVGRGAADVAVGTKKIADQVNNVSFVPLMRERNDLVIKKESLNDLVVKTLIKILRSQAFKDEIGGLGDYDTSYTGEKVGEV